MCEPITAALASVSTQTMMMASLAVSAVSTGVNYMAQQQNAAAQVEAQEKNLEAQRDASVKSMIQQGTDLQQRELQERAATGLRTQAAREKIDRAKATANATSQSAGLSFDALMSDFDTQFADFESSQLQQLGFNTDQLQRTREGIEATAQGRVNTLPRTPVARPSIFGAAASFGADALGTLNRFSVVDPLTGDPTFT